MNVSRRIFCLATVLLAVGFMAVHAATSTEGWLAWLRDTFENLQSEMWQVAWASMAPAAVGYWLGIRQQGEQAEGEDLERLEGKLDDVLARLDRVHLPPM